MPELPMLVVSMHDEVLYAERALRAGARGYVMKREALDSILNAIRERALGRHLCQSLDEQANAFQPYPRPRRSVAARLRA